MYSAGQVKAIRTYAAPSEIGPPYSWDILPCSTQQQQGNLADHIASISYSTYSPQEQLRVNLVDHVPRLSWPAQHICSNLQIWLIMPLEKVTTLKIWVITSEWASNLFVLYVNMKMIFLYFPVDPWIFTLKTSSWLNRHPESRRWDATPTEWAKLL
jgi:hypothetical protein